MDDIIQLLPDSIANQIAAGEVVQRPASVVKELLENAIDAGATDIKLIIKDAGRTLIQVIDNGKGMSSTDARLAFERHATSKIRTAKDLFSLTTMGFRGEALPSIAAVSLVELRTRRAEDELGVDLTISASELEKQEPISTPIGSNFSIKNLFFNVPARRKFLKSNETEKRNILNEFERVSLVRNDISFSYIENDIEYFNFPETNSKQRILNVIGKNLNQQLIPIEIETTLVKIRGYIGKPESARKSKPQQYFFVNGRYMRHPYFAKAITTVFEPLISPTEHPLFFIYLEVEPDTIDVNIHPTKTEIKFENEQAIWQILSATVKEALGKSNEVPSIDFNSEQSEVEIPLMRDSNVGIDSLRPKINLDPNYNPFKSTNRQNPYSKPTGNNYQRQNITDWEKLYENFDQESSIKESTSILNDLDRDSYSDAIYYQYKNKYILTSVKSGLMIIDQRRAHIRILYDKLLNTIRSKKGLSQRVLFPEIIEFTPSESMMLPYIIDDLEALGFEISDLGGNSFAINAIPAEIKNFDSISFIRDILQKNIDRGTDTREEIQESLALLMAKSTAIRYGQALNLDEISSLISDLFMCSVHKHTSDGKTIIVLFNDSDIEKKFQ